MDGKDEDKLTTAQAIAITMKCIIYLIIIVSAWKVAGSLVRSINGFDERHPKPTYEQRRECEELCAPNAFDEMIYDACSCDITKRIEKIR